MEPFFREGYASWNQLQDVPNRSFVCGFCTVRVSSVKGYSLMSNERRVIGSIHICPNCGGPVFACDGHPQCPSPALGSPVQYVPDDLNALYEEARRCTGQSCFTAAVLLCRKMLMHMAVEQSAPVGQNFMEYVNYLSDKGYVPPNGKLWVDHIRKKGNEANHEITLMKETDARELLIFVEMLLKFMYEFPKMITPPAPPS